MKKPAKRSTIFWLIGMVLSVGLSITERFIVEIPDTVAIPILVVALLFFGLGFYHYQVGKKGAK